jgi:hypothetical protein
MNEIKSIIIKWSRLWVRRNIFNPSEWNPNFAFHCKTAEHRDTRETYRNSYDVGRGQCLITVVQNKKKHI